MFLEIDEDALNRVKREYGCYIQEGLTQMLQIWLESGRATWSDLVHSLCEVGRTALARKIAAEIGMSCHSLVLIMPHSLLNVCLLPCM